MTFALFLSKKNPGEKPPGRWSASCSYTPTATREHVSFWSRQDRAATESINPFRRRRATGEACCVHRHVQCSLVLASHDQQDNGRRAQVMRTRGSRGDQRNIVVLRCADFFVDGKELLQTRRQLNSSSSSSNVSDNANGTNVADQHERSHRGVSKYKRTPREAPKQIACMKNALVRTQGYGGQTQETELNGEPRVELVFLA